MLLEENNPLFDSLMNKLSQFPELKAVISRQLFQGQPIAYVPDDTAVRNAWMFGLVKIQDSTVQIANRIFEVRLYNKFLLDYREQNSEIYAEGSRQKNQFVIEGHLNVRHVLEKFVKTLIICMVTGERLSSKKAGDILCCSLNPLLMGGGIVM